MKQKLLTVMVALFAMSATACTTIDSGEAGVLFRAFGGTEMDQVYGEGFHLVAPWNTMYVYNIKVRDAKETMDVVTSNGLTVGAEFSMRFRPLREELPLLHQKIGRLYYNEVLGPIFRSAARQVLGRYKPEEIYSTKREAVEQEAFELIEAGIAGKHLVVEGVFMRSFQLPDQLKQAINNKLTQEQRSQEMEFVLMREKQEAERKRIEAEGVRDFQTIVSQGISERLLKWKGIEATIKLAESPNAKIVVMGNSGDSLPVILSADK